MSWRRVDFERELEGEQVQIHYIFRINLHWLWRNQVRPTTRDSYIYFSLTKTIKQL